MCLDHAFFRGVESPSIQGFLHFVKTQIAPYCLKKSLFALISLDSFLTKAYTDRQGIPVCIEQIWNQFQLSSLFIRQAVKDRNIHRIGNQVLDCDGHTVLRVGIAHQLYIIMRNRRLETGVKRDHLDQLAHDRHPAGRQRKRNRAVDQQHKCCRRSSYAD